MNPPNLQSDSDSPSGLIRENSRKRRRVSSENAHMQAECTYSPSNTRIVRVLRNDTRNKVICLHVKFKDSLDKDAIVVLEKSPFPSEIADLCEAQIGLAYSEKDEKDVTKEQQLPSWVADEIVCNDIYHQLSVKSGLERANCVNMTVISPAQSNHFAKYSSSKRQVVYETPEIYRNVILPFIESNPKDLSWVENILNGVAEVDRVLFTNDDAKFGFTLVLDYRWNGNQLNELHTLALAKDPELKCIRDLRSCHLPMLREMLLEGKKRLVAKYSEGKGELREDQLIAYFHYPPTFYRLHMHFIHVDKAADGGTQAGKAILAEDVIANVEIKSEYFAERTMPIYLHDSHPFLHAIRDSEKP